MLVCTTSPITVRRRQLVGVYPYALAIACLVYCANLAPVPAEAGHTREVGVSFCSKMTGSES